MTSPDNSQSRREWVLAALEQFEGRLTRYATKLLGDDEAARDAVQHTFLRLCDAAPESLDGRLAAWLFAVCRNKALDALRRNGRADFAADAESDALAGREPDPAATTEAGELHARLRILVAELPGSQRETIDLWCEGFSYREIAEITSRAEGHTRVLVHRALTQLREHPFVRELLAEENESPKPPRLTATQRGARARV